GSVDFQDTTTGTDLGTVPLSGGSASLTTSDLGNGTHSITATYRGDGGFLSNTSAGVNVRVRRKLDDVLRDEEARTLAYLGHLVTLNNPVDIAELATKGTPGRGYKPSHVFDAYQGQGVEFADVGPDVNADTGIDLDTDPVLSLEHPFLLIY